MSLPYNVPGLKVVLAQPTSLVCWATVYTMMNSWRRQLSLSIPDAVGAVGARYAAMFAANEAMPPEDFIPFLRAAGMNHEPMVNLTIEGWEQKLRSHGLLWVGTMNTDNSGRHSRIIEGMSGNGSTGGTTVKIIDPDGGRRYDEPFTTFLSKYESAFTARNDTYYQIRHY
jgi:hypothetical protein